MEQTNEQQVVIVQEDKKDDNKKRNKIWAYIIAAIVIISVIIGASVGANSNDDKDNNGVTFIEKQFNETFTLEGLDITITSYEFRYYALYDTLPAGNGKVWLVINAKIYNNSTQNKDIDLSNKMIYYSNGEEATYNSKYYNYNEWINTHEEIDPFETIDGIYMYEIPISIAPQVSGSYERGSKYTANSKQNINFEFRIQKNLKAAKEIYIVKL